MEICLIRHGMTAGNAQFRYIGRTDEPLSPEGIRLAQNTRLGIRCGQVYVTPLRRTAETASILFPGAEQIAVDGLREMDFGVFENRSAQEMEQDDEYRRWVDGQCVDACPGGESRADFSERVCRAFSALIGPLRARGADNAVFVVHGGTIMAILERFAEPKRAFYEYRVENCGGYHCTVSDGQPFSLGNLIRLEQIG